MIPVPSITPTPGPGTILAMDSLSFSLSSALPIRRTIVIVEHSNDLSEVVYDGSQFLDPYSGFGGGLPSSPWAWLNPIGISVFGSSLTKTGAAGWNAGAVSGTTLSGDGRADFSVGEASTDKFIGLCLTDPAGDYTTINFGIYLSGSGIINVYESNVYIFSAPDHYLANDTFQIVILGSTVTYCRNNIPFFTSPNSPTFPLYLGAVIYSTGATVNNASFISGGDITLTFTRNFGWPAASFLARIYASNSNGNGIDYLGGPSDYAYTVSNPPIGPAIANLSPANGASVYKNTLIEFDVTDGATIVLTEIQIDQGPVREVVFDGTSFVSPYQGSQRTTITGGYHYVIIRYGGWVTSPVFHVVALDINLGVL